MTSCIAIALSMFLMLHLYLRTPVPTTGIDIGRQSPFTYVRYRLTSPHLFMNQIATAHSVRIRKAELCITDVLSCRQFYLSEMLAQPAVAKTQTAAAGVRLIYQHQQAKSCRPWNGPLRHGPVSEGSSIACFDNSMLATTN